MTDVLMTGTGLTALLDDAGVYDHAVIPAEPVDDEAREVYRRWIDDGRHAAMRFAERYGDVRDDPRMLLDGARCMVVCLIPFPSAPAGQPPYAAHVAEYALGEDYHTIVRRHLIPVAAEIDRRCGSASRVCVDTAPLRERYWAARAGLGFIGRNNMLTVAGVGAHFIIATIVTTARLPLSGPRRARGHCGTCRRCADACPARAIAGDGTCLTDRCHAYLSIEAPDAAANFPGGSVFGCDICRRVCPHHHPAHTNGMTLGEFAPHPDIVALDADTWRALTPSAYRHLTRGTALSRKRRTR